LTSRILVPVVLLAASLLSAAALLVRDADADPLGGEWYLEHDHAQQAQNELATVTMHPVTVAVIDSGIDGGHPAIADSIAAARSFIGGSPFVDRSGHGTFVAGEIIATATAAVGARPSGSPIGLAIAKVAAANGLVDEEAEVQAIRWAVSIGARVMNLSLGGTRDPRDPRLDTYSADEAAAVRYAISHGVVVVAAVGNGTEAPKEPWLYADWPAALPHVIGVSAIDPNGAVPEFSNRDRRYNDIAAPGVDIVSTVPRALTAALPRCPDQGYSDCAGAAFDRADGTSFAAPQVSAAAALLISIEPGLSPDQVAWLLERTADDANPTTGCARCTVGRDSFTGWGTLDIDRAINALSGPIPSADPCATSNDGGREACRLGDPPRAIAGSLDYWDHPLDVYALRLRRGQAIGVNLDNATASVELLLWQPGTSHLAGADGPPPIKPSPRPLLVSDDDRLVYTAVRTGQYDLEVVVTSQQACTYTLVVSSPRRRLT
jgi:hypothetical protein